MPKKNDFKLDVVSVRLVKDAPIYSEHTFNNPADIAAVMGDCMCQFDREVVCVVNLRSDLKSMPDLDVPALRGGNSYRYGCGY